MKTAIVLYQNAAGEPVKALDGRSLLEAARSRRATKLAQDGCCGWAPSPTTHQGLLAQACGMSTEEAVRLCRGPVEAWTLDAPPASGDMVFHVDLVAEDGGIIRSAPVPGLQETQELALALNRGVDSSRERYACAAPGSLLVMLRGVAEELPMPIPVHLVLGQERSEVLPGGRGTMRLREVMDQAAEILSRHPVNDLRVNLGEDPANGIWLSGGGRWPDAAEKAEPMPSVAMLTQSLVGRGMARMFKIPFLDLIRPDPGDREPWFHVPDLVAALHTHETIVVEWVLRSHLGPVEQVRELDRADEHLLTPLMEIVSAHRPCRILVVGGSPEVHGSGPWHRTRQPVVVAGDEIHPDEVEHWDEAACARGILGQINLGRFVRNLRTAG